MRGGPQATLLRPEYSDLAIYQPDRTICDIDLSDNTNLFGVPPAAEAVLRAAPRARITRYPSLYGDGVKAGVAAWLGVLPEEVVTGCGSDDVLDCTIRAFAPPGSTLVAPAPSFVMVAALARANRVRCVEVPLTGALDLDVDAMLAADGAITYVCSPNNPTGNLMSGDAIRAILERAVGLVILDEAYADFAGVTFVREAVRSGRAIVVRTMSKAFGLAGLRVGVGVAAAELVREVEKARGPYKIGALAEDAVTAALKSDLEWVKERATECITLRDRFTDALRGDGFSPISSDGNFVLVPVAGALAIGRQMRDAGVAVRAFAGLPVVGDALRITVGPWPMMESALNALRGTTR